MEVRFDSEAAEKLLAQMDRYCKGVRKESKELNSIINNNNGGWDDNQRKAFCSNIEVIMKGLDVVNRQEEEYMEIFRQKVNELKG